MKRLILIVAVVCALVTVWAASFVEAGTETDYFKRVAGQK